MSGLEKIIGQITGESTEKAASILKEAGEKAEFIKEETIRKAAAEIDLIEKKADAEVKAIGERADASASLRRKQILLAGKQEIINAAIQLAKDRLEALSGREYEEFIRSVFEKHVPESDAVLILSEKAKGLLSEQAVNGLVELAKEKGSRLTVSEETADAANGFILDFGGVEENCSFEALISQNMEEIEDSVIKKIFTEE